MEANQSTTEMMQALAEALDAALNDPGEREVGFCLLVFPFNDTAAGCVAANYISNAERHDVIGALQSAAEHLKSRPVRAH